MLSKDLICLDTSPRSHIYLVHQNDGWVMIDTGFPKLAKNIINELQTLQIDPHDIKSILLTHGDVDHVGNLKKLMQIIKCDVYADANELPYLAKQKAYSFRKRLLKIVFRTPKFKNIKALPNNTIGELKIIKTPGHTPGHVCYVYKDCLLAGDLISTPKGVINLMNEKFTHDKETYLKAIKSLDLHDINYICPAHGEIIDAHPK
jgi:glyoxylase-like metal-dependent hydrolase (beta-lactamase superfamily II)